MKDRRSGVPNAKIRIRPATRASDREDEQSRGIVLAQVPPAVDTIRFEHKPHGGIPSIRTCVRLSDDPSDHTSDELHGGIEPPTRAPTKAVGSRRSCSRLQIPSKPFSGFDHLVSRAAGERRYSCPTTMTTFPFLCPRST